MIQYEVYYLFFLANRARWLFQIIRVQTGIIIKRSLKYPDNLD